MFVGQLADFIEDKYLFRMPGKPLSFLPRCQSAVWRIFIEERGASKFIQSRGYSNPGELFDLFGQVQPDCMFGERNTGQLDAKQTTTSRSGTKQMHARKGNSTQIRILRCRPLLRFAGADDVAEQRIK
jgi:hypothetical protein